MFNTWNNPASWFICVKKLYEYRFRCLFLDSKIIEMKKLLFVAIAIAGVSGTSMAQEAKKSAEGTTAVSPRAQSRTPEERAKYAKAGAENKEKAAAPAKQEAKSTAATPNANYKKVGLTSEQISTINNDMAALDQKKTIIENNKDLNDVQRNEQLQAIEKERSAVLRKSMGPEKFQKYTEITTPAIKPVKAAN